MMTVTYGFEHDRRLRAGFIGCGGHSFRNVYPVLRYLPVDLVAACAPAAAGPPPSPQTFGAQPSSPAHADMLPDQLDCVFVAPGVSSYTDIAVDCLSAGG